jgi:hypothetical protein
VDQGEADQLRAWAPVAQAWAEVMRRLGYTGYIA